MSADATLTPTEYISHHLTHGTARVGDSGFWTIHYDSLAVAVILGFIGIGFLWWVVRGATSGVPGRRQAFVELLINFVDDQAKGIFKHGDRNVFVAPAVDDLHDVLVADEVDRARLGDEARRARGRADLRARRGRRRRRADSPAIAFVRA